MSKKEIFQVASKILGLYGLIQCVFVFQGFVAQLLYGDYSLLGIMFVEFAIHLVLGLTLIKRADDISGFLLGSDTDTVVNFSPDKFFLIEIVFVIIGLIIFANAIPMVLLELYRYIQGEASGTEYVQHPFNADVLIRNAIYLIVGYALISNSRFFSKKVFGSRQKELEREGGKK